jgi:hypothetical protein
MITPAICQSQKRLLLNVALTASRRLMTAKGTS